MDGGILVETLPLFGNCCLCLKLDVVKSMLIPEINGNNTETYSEILQKCFSINVSEIAADDTKCLICEVCIEQLQLCFKFKNQVETSLKSLEEMRVKNDDDILLSQFKQELNDSDYHEETNEDILNGMMLKEELDEYQPRKRRKKQPSSDKKVTYSLVCQKVVDLEETEGLIAAGLFPFKMNKDDTFSCTVCPEKCPNLEDLRTHVSQHSIPNLATAFKKMDRSNSQKFKKDSKCLKCKSCGTEIKSFDEMARHVDVCLRQRCRWNKLPFKLEKDQLDCPICKKTFLNFVTLNTHMNEHYPNHTCSSCGKSFASRSRLRGHLRTHEIGTFPCRFCDVVFDKVTKRENHVSKEHKSGIRYVCKRCDISLPSFYARQKHLAEVHDEELKRYKCKACTQSYITPGHLSSHVRRDHLNERNHKCPKCELAFYTRNSLKMHMVKHDGARVHACGTCGKAYQRLKTLREHARIHANDKRFVCPVCARAFTQKCTLKGHLRVHERAPHA